MRLVQIYLLCLAIMSFSGTVTTVERQIKGRWKMNGMTGREPPNKTPPAKIAAIMAEVGTKPDLFLADKFNVSYDTVNKIRNKKGIAPYKKVGPILVTPRAKNGASLAQQKEMFKYIGKISDAEIGRMLGLSKRPVANFRKRNGVTPYPGKKGRLR